MLEELAYFVYGVTVSLDDIDQYNIDSRLFAEYMQSHTDKTPAEYEEYHPGGLQDYWDKFICKHDHLWYRRHHCKNVFPIRYARYQQPYYFVIGYRLDESYFESFTIKDLKSDANDAKLRDIILDIVGHEVDGTPKFHILEFDPGAEVDLY